MRALRRRNMSVHDSKDEVWCRRNFGASTYDICVNQHNGEQLMVDDATALKTLNELIETLLHKVGELELRVSNSDDEIKALSSRITQIEVLSRPHE